MRVDRRVKLYGVGINDADYVTQPSDRTQRCPYYDRWHSMLRRCYGKRNNTKWGTEAIVVAEEWRLFSNFAGWMRAQDWKDNALDKDWLGPGTLYSASTCAFIPQVLNSAIMECAGDKFPLGVYEKFLDGRTNRFVAQVFTDQRKLHLGVYSTASQAHKAWKLAKAKSLSRILAAHKVDARVKIRVEKLIDSIRRSGDNEIWSLNRLLLEQDSEHQRH